MLTLVLSLESGVGGHVARHCSVLGIVESLTLHGDILSEVLVTVHAGGKLGAGASLLEVERLALHGDVVSEVLIAVHASRELGKLAVVEGLALHGDVLAEILVAIHTSGELSELLVEVEGLALHSDVVAEILVTVHAGGELDELGVAFDADNTALQAGGGLDEASGGGGTLVVGEDLSRLGAVRGLSDDGGNDGKNELHFKIIIIWLLCY